MSDQSTRVFIVAPSPAMRAGLRALLAGAELLVVGEAPGLALAPAAELVLAAGEGVPALARAIAGPEGAALVAMSDDETLPALLRDLPLRGWAVVTSEAGRDELRAAALAANQGLAAMPRAWAERLAGPRPLAEAPGEGLTVRELEVLALISQGLPNKQIAGQLQISEHTVKFHIASIFGKLNAASRTEAVSIGARRGLITL